MQSVDPIIVTQLRAFNSSSGRKISLNSKIKNCFYNPKNSMIAPPKKEYLRCRVIRGHKRAIRQIKKSAIPIRTLNAFDPENPTALRIWRILSDVYIKHEEELSKFSQTESGPKTDGKSKRQGKVENLAKSFNYEFCRDYFTPLGVRESFYYYVELLFVDLNPKSLCEKFDFNCCKSPHSHECLEKWLLMKKYISQYMIQELGLEPFMPASPEGFHLPSLFNSSLDQPPEISTYHRRLRSSSSSTLDSNSATKTSLSSGDLQNNCKGGSRDK
ncbi:unnamed protein product [Blepharisma stoltei]|uniref:Uncharacterized protein n=1 Tax=Blepharisma stoltei TaxID=1481888 RepID=A0AAU9JKG3_9CILI|nr:unnamed protein product [Blepharisma stoltei]